MDTASLLRGLRFVDNFFPSGGYAFSSGLEAAVQHGAVTDGESLRRYGRDLLHHGLARRDAVAAGRAHDATVVKDLESIIESDIELDAMKLGREDRLASRQMGRQLLRITGRPPAEDICSVPADYLAAVQHERAPGHLAIAFGVSLAMANWSRDDTVAALLYQSAVGIVSAGLKLLPIGQRQGQDILEGWLPLISAMSSQAKAAMDMSSFAPVQDIYAMRHSRLSSRLFRS